MARRVFLHLGTAKSGTTYLQELWWRHRDVLREQGLLLPGDSVSDHFHAAALVKSMNRVVAELTPEQQRTWDRLVAETAAWPDDVLISHEHFSDSSPAAATEALAGLRTAAEEVHVVLTVRDLARVLPSAWQQRVKQGSRQAYGAFLSTVRDRPDERFWSYQDVGGILDRWTVGVPAERVHLVVVPQSGAPRDLLWERACEALGLRLPPGLDTASRQPNESLGLVEAELLRRVNRAVPREERSVALTRVTKGFFARRVLAGAAPDERFALPPEHHGWVDERARKSVEDLRARGLHVVGDLDELVPRPPASTGRTPDDATDAELLDAAAVVVARLLVRERDRALRRRRATAPPRTRGGPGLLARLLRRR